MDRELILDKMKELNKESFLPKYVFRRNSVYYQLATYMNHIISLFISENFNPIPIFINRVKKRIQILEDNIDDLDTEYIQKCVDLIQVLEEELKTHSFKDL